MRQLGKFALTRARRLNINDDLQTINQVLYLVSASPAAQQPELRAFLELGQTALRRLADTIARSDSLHVEALPVRAKVPASARH